MNQVSFNSELRAINSKGSKFPFIKLLKEQYNIEVPPGAPLYQAEYLYKYVRYAEVQGSVPPNKLVAHAATKADELFGRFPWLKNKYDTIVIKKSDKTMGSKSEKAEYPDGTIIFCEKRNKFLMYQGGAIVVRAATKEKVKSIAQKKLGFSAFIE